MKANELRIGNLIQGIKYKSAWRIECFLGSTMATVDAGHVSFPTDDLHDIELIKCEPIPLTEEWLKRFGFVKSENRAEWKINSFRICDAHYDGLVWPDSSFNLIQVKSVHHLQNLYFALTGEELCLQS